MGKVKRNVLLAVSLVTVLAGIAGTALFFANRHAAKEEKDAVSGKTVTVWAWDDTFNVKAMKMAASLYEQSHQDVKINVVSMEQNDILNTLSNYLAAGITQSLPDVVLIEDYQSKNILTRYKDDFLDLTNIIDYSRYMDYKKEVVSLGDKSYGIPFDSGTTALFYRKDLIEAAGYTEADMQNLTWEAYIDIGKKIHEKTGKYMLSLDPGDLGLIRIMLQSAGSWYVGSDGNTVTIDNNPVLRKAVSLYLQMVDEDVAKSAIGWDQFASVINNGDVATVVTGCWVVSTIRQSQSQAGLWRVAAIPTISKTSASSNIGGSSWYIMKHGKEEATALDFMKSYFVNNTDFTNTLVDEIGLFPGIKSLDQLGYMKKADAFFGGQKIMEFLAGQSKDLPAVNYGMNTYDIENILASGLQNILKSDDVAGNLAKVQKKAEALTTK